MSTATEEVQTPPHLTISKIAAWAVYAWVFLGIILLGLRVFLLAFSANAATPFVNFIYRTSADYLAPFRGIFPPRSVGETGYLDVAALFAIIMYLLFAWALSSLIGYIQGKIDHSKKQQLLELAREQEAARTAAPRHTVTTTTVTTKPRSTTHQ